MPTPDEWLDRPWEGDLPFEAPFRPEGLPDAPTRLQVFAALVEMNGGTRVRGWGYIDGGGIYGRRGLHQNEALCLLELSAFLNGMLCALGDPPTDAFSARVAEEWDRVKAITMPEAPPPGG